LSLCEHVRCDSLGDGEHLARALYSNQVHAYPEAS
jgi:hypothetical protein